MKRVFEEPIVEIVEFSVEDIITDSDGYTSDPDEGSGAPLGA